MVVSKISNIQTRIKDMHFQYFLWNSPQVNAINTHWFEVNIGSGNGLVPSDNKPLPEPTLTHSQYHGCWCPGSLRRQGINIHDIDYVE